MASAARQPLAAWRNEPCVIPITLPGFNLTGHTVRMQVRIAPDTPGAALLDIEQTTDVSALGIRVVDLDQVDGVYTTKLALQIPKASMQSLPFAGEVGDPFVGAYALQVDGATRLFGSFAAIASPIDSDGAPTSRPVGYSASSAASIATDGVILTLGDGGVTVSISGLDLIAPLVAAAEAAAESADLSAGQVAGKMDKSGGIFTGAVNMSGNPLGGIAASDDPNSAVPRGVVDTIVPGFTSTYQDIRLGDYGNLYIVERGVMDTALSGANGDVLPGAPGVFITGYIPVKPGQALRFNLPVHSYAFYDKDLRFISGFEANPNYAPPDTPVAVPPRAFAWRAFFGIGDLYRLYVTTAASLPVLIRQHMSRSRWHGKRIGWLTDSQFARNAGYVAQRAVCEDLGAIDTPFTNDCVSGRRFGEVLPGRGTAETRALTSEAIAPLDGLISLHGPNDWDVPDRPPGTYGDAITAGTTAADIRAQYELIYQLNAGIRHVVLLPNKRGVFQFPDGGPRLKGYKEPNSYGWVLEQYVDLIRAIAADYGNQCIDLFRDLPFTDLTFGRYSNDNIHLNYAVGQPMLADFLSARLRAA